ELDRHAQPGKSGTDDGDVDGVMGIHRLSLVGRWRLTGVDIGCAPCFCFGFLDRTPLQRKIELFILKKILNNLPENIV
ncbi:MAG: hypothetical protein ACRESN_13980, partial [Pseudomonas sp.]